MTLARQTILVTGGLGGIGLAVVHSLAAKGANVFATGRGLQRPETLPVSASYRRLDVSSEQAWQDMIDVIVERHGSLDGLVNIAGVLPKATPFEDTTLAQWRQTMAVNLDGTFVGCRMGIKTMARTGGGAIVNFSSGAARIVVSEAAAYCVSKAAVVALTRVAAKAGGPYNVRVNAILPGAIDTAMLWSNLRPGQQPGDLIDQLERQHPIGRIGQTADIAQSVVFLLDQENSFISGACLAVDGGQLVD
jgi:NAD(P)-dependent dehydrogenase (short-subunit alcohol dehydrogenase family)